MKIKANVESSKRYRLKMDVYIDGEKSLRCLEADEREGIAWVMREKDGQICTEHMGTVPGDYVSDGVIIDLIHGNIEFRFNLNDSDPSEEEVRREIAAHYIPLTIRQIVQS